MRENEKSILKLTDICVSFSGVSVLKNASFSLAQNEVHAIVGKNGAGKSSFMKVVTGVYIPDSGKICIDGHTHDAHELKKQKRTSDTISMVYQDLSLVPSLSVLQNIFLSNHPYKKFGILQDAKAHAYVKNILQSIGASSILPHTLVEDLSVGESQLVEIAKAMANNPKIIIFDEPTASLSDIETKNLFKTIKKLQSQGISIIYITHYLEDVMNICDSVTVLRNGEVVASESIANTSISNIVEHMLGDETLSESVSNSKNTIGKKKLLELVDAKTSSVGPLSLCAYEGEIIGLAGLLGSGRTEILRLLYGLDILESGEMKINGTKVMITHPSIANRHKIALVPEERRTQGLVLDFSIEENIAIPILSKLKNKIFLDTKKRVLFADNTIESLDIKTNSRKQLVRFLSGGNQQKVVVGKCLATEPQILLLDDPTFGVDIHAKTEIMDIIQKFAQKGNVVIFVSSEFSEIARVCTRTYIVKKQKIVEEIKNNNLSEEYLLKVVQ